MIVETHVHICDERYDSDRDDMLKRAFSAGVTKHINIGAEVKETRKVVDFEAEGVFKAIGLHPHYVEQCTDGFFEEYKSYFREKKNIVAVGEIGLDYFKSPTSRDIQEKFFRKFIDVAKEVNLPVIIHSREAHDDVYKILKEYAIEKKGIIHCFTGNYETAKKFNEMGYLIGIGGVLTFPNAGELVETVKKLELSNIALETDAPWLAPQAVRGTRNEPSYLRFIADALAQVKGVSVEEVEEKTTENACKLFGI